jgi:hypothetical protein
MLKENYENTKNKITIENILKQLNILNKDEDNI